LDVETTGLDPEKNGVIQIGALIEMDSKFVESFTQEVRTFSADEVSEKALAISGKTEDAIAGFLDPTIAYKIFVGVLGRYVDKYNPADKFTLAGYNVKFDCDFMKAWFEKCGDKYWFSYVTPPFLDPLPVMTFLKLCGLIQIENVKLTTVCEFFGIDLDAHDALSDVKATRGLCRRLVDILPSIGDMEPDGLALLEISQRSAGNNYDRCGEVAE
jgi:DNA polymerase III epsilon subunit-like protein